MKPNRYFPLGKAYGEAFCNRTKETEKLTSNVLRGVHSYLIAPRRYGKSSLAENAIQKSRLKWNKVDFHLAVTEKHAERLILKGVTDLIGKSISQVDKLTNIIKESLKNLTPKFNINTGPLSLELEVSSQSFPAENVFEALYLLDKLLQKRDTKAIFLFDEFQEVGQVSQGKGIEGAIRSMAQETQNLAIIFSGSNPHLLSSMFENERRPLFRLCKKLEITRIDREHYKDHLNKASQKAWETDLPETIFDEIMNLSERHPYFVNALCDEIWNECDSVPSITKVHECWSIIVEGERSDLIKDFLQLSDNQRKVLMHIANYSGKGLFSSQTFDAIKMAPGSVHTAVTTLMERDFVEKVGDDYRLIVPAYRDLLQYD